MAAKNFYLTMGLTMSLCGDEQEVLVDATVRYSPGCEDYWDKCLGAWLPGDPPEVELQEVAIEGEEVQPWLFNLLYRMDWHEVLATEGLV